jgi:F-box and leucine-rich repeat protein GRR1
LLTCIAVLQNSLTRGARTIISLAYFSPNLHGVDLSGLIHVTDMGILELTTKSLPLEWIRLNGVTSLGDSSISAIVKTCPYLREFEICDLPFLTAISVRDLWSYARNLRVLRMARCRSLTDKAFPAPRGDGELDAVGPDFKPLPLLPTCENWELPPLILPHASENLRVLDLSGCTQLTDTAIEGIVLHAPRIQNFALSGCSQLTDKAVISICALGRCLHTLNLGHITTISDRAIIKLARSCPNLKSIDLACTFAFLFLPFHAVITRGCQFVAFSPTCPFSKSPGWQTYVA